MVANRSRTSQKFGQALVGDVKLALAHDKVNRIRNAQKFAHLAGKGLEANHGRASRRQPFGSGQGVHFLLSEGEKGEVPELGLPVVL